MNRFKTFTLAVIALAGFAATAQDRCDIDISIANISKGEVVPEAINSRLEAKLAQAIGKAGFSSAPYDSRFFIAGRFDDAFNDIGGGTSQKVYVRTTLTLYIGDADEQKIFATESFELTGVGSSDTQAYTRALAKLNAGNSKLIEFITQGRQKIIDYYDANYRTYINKALQAMAARNYDEVIFILSPIPSCCKGYAEASELALKALGDKIDYEGNLLLAKAKAEWAADPTAGGAAKACAYLAQIDPGASCMKEAETLGNQISKTTQKQWEFENVTKYKDELALKKMRIEAVKEAAVAYAKNQPKQQNRYIFLTPRYR